jgi:hypothetical protein
MIRRLLINTFLLFNSYYSVVTPLPINKYKPIRNSSLNLIHNNNNTCRDLFNHNRNSKISIMLRKNNDYNINVMNLINLINFYICIIKVLKFINLF